MDYGTQELAGRLQDRLATLQKAREQLVQSDTLDPRLVRTVLLNLTEAVIEDHAMLLGEVLRRANKTGELTFVGLMTSTDDLWSASVNVETVLGTYPLLGYGYHNGPFNWGFFVGDATKMVNDLAYIMLAECLANSRSATGVTAARHRSILVCSPNK